MAIGAYHERFAQVERHFAIRLRHVALEQLDELRSEIRREMRLTFHEQLACHSRMRITQMVEQMRELALQIRGLELRVRYAMRIDSLEDMMKKAIDNGVKIIACSMSMDVMGIRPEELIDGVEIGGVGTYLGDAEESDVNLFI